MWWVLVIGYQVLGIGLGKQKTRFCRLAKAGFDYLYVALLFLRFFFWRLIFTIVFGGNFDLLGFLVVINFKGIAF